MEGIKLFLIDSKDRLSHSASTTDCIFQFNAFGATNAEVVSFQMPMTQYNINATNNNVYFNDGSNRNFTITIGNYSVYDFIDELETKFNSVSANYTVTYSDISMKIAITGLVPFQLLFGTNTIATSAYIMGFNNVNQSLALSQSSDNCINLSLPLYICCNISEFNTNIKATNDTSSTFVFPNKVNCGDILSYSEMTDFKQCTTISEGSIQSLRIRFTIPGNYPLNANNADWMMVLRLHYC